MPVIFLSQGKTALVSWEDFEAVACFKWYANRASRKGRKDLWYAKRKIRHEGRETVVYLHRYIVSRREPLTPGMVVAHLDDNGLNCQRENLAQQTHLENAAAHLYKPKEVREPWL